MISLNTSLHHKLAISQPSFGMGKIRQAADNEDLVEASGNAEGYSDHFRRKYLAAASKKLDEYIQSGTAIRGGVREYLPRQVNRFSTYIIYYDTKNGAQDYTDFINSDNNSPGDFIYSAGDIPD